MLSVIIPAYKATKYIDDCIASIKGDCEILIGVDACEETYSHIKHLKNVYYFKENVGPYVIKNTLVDEAKYDDILFFDSDDVMAEGTIEKIIEALKTKDYVKLSYIDFTNKPLLRGNVYNNAVIGIKKSVFNSINGFYPWRCSADTEITYRLEHNNLSCKTMPDVCYYRRLHKNNLTVKKETRHGSPIRKTYVNYINLHLSKQNWPNPPIKTIQDYVKD
jgi:glycosyltransferase involved in cell wall biosynthesis